MHKLLAVIISTVILASPLAAGAIAGGPTLNILVSSSTAAVDGQVTATVQMDTKTYQVTAADLHFTYPSDKLQVMSIGASTFLPSVLTAGSVGTGTAAITVGSGTQAKQGTGPVAVIIFRALAPGQAVIGFAGTTAVAAVGNASNVVDTMSSATVTVTSAQASLTPVPSAYPSPTYYPTPTPVYGQPYTPTPLYSPIGGAGQVSTGPMESTMLALVVGAIAALLYVGYSSSEHFRRRELTKMGDEDKEPLDFKK